MRLLQLSHGELSLTKFVSDVPPYAILSHTWATDDSEVIFSDINNETAKNKTVAFKKLKFCGERALSDGLDYFWVDTCCINQKDSVEQSEAINSMFRWYRKATRCYVYLPDVSATIAENENAPAREVWISAFLESRWFKRGWTLQELLAPASVEFYSLEGTLLGDRQSLEEIIHFITNIPISALQGTPLSEFTVSERMEWATKRNTKREEDIYYALMGIFGVYMAAIYGEGREHARLRLLEEIDKRAKSEFMLNPESL
jgi:Heterokaryon incompatibility protein (HET)